MVESKHYINVDPEAARNFFGRSIEGPLTMLHLLRFREIADYAATPQLIPTQILTGEEAFRLFIKNALPILRATGGDLVFFGTAFPFLIGPQTELWDRAMILRQSSLQSLITIAANSNFNQIMGHRTAALADCRLLPLKETELL